LFNNNNNVNNNEEEDSTTFSGRRRIRTDVSIEKVKGLFLLTIIL